MKQIRVEIEKGSLPGLGFAEFNRHLHKEFTAAGVKVEAMEFSDAEPPMVTQRRWIEALQRAGATKLQTFIGPDKDVILLNIPDSHG